MDLRQYYSDAYTHLEKQLEIDIYKFEQFDDDTYLDDQLFIWFGVITELTFFGVKPVFFKSREGWIEDRPVLENPQDLETLEAPDFFKSGLMPRIHRFYEEMKELVQGRCTIMFPDWARGPFCMAAHLRGLQNLLIDMVTEPEFVHRLMRFVTDARKQWCTQRSEFLGEPIQKGKFYNDEVDCPTLSPYMYREFILPYEQELSEFHGGITYWHSCGNSTVFMEEIRTLPQLEMFHVSPWGDLSKAVSVMSPKIALDVNMDPLADVLECAPERMETRLQQIVRTCGDISYCVRADAFQVVHGLEQDLEKIKQWARVARRVLHN
jgi:uroporphyrinogen-III decarboxylase